MSFHIPSEQKALFIDDKEGFLRVAATEVPRPGSGEVLIRVESAGLNPVDWKISALLTAFPAILGTDSAGVVVEVGEGVTDITVGDRV